MSLSNKSLRDQDEDDPFGNLSGREKVVDQMGSGSFFDEIKSM